MRDDGKKVRFLTIFYALCISEGRESLNFMHIEPMRDFRLNEYVSVHVDACSMHASCMLQLLLTDSGSLPGFL